MKKSVAGEIRKDDPEANQKSDKMRTHFECYGLRFHMNKAMMVRALMDEIIVYDDEIEIHFKCGVIRRKKYVL